MMLRLASCDPHDELAIDCPAVARIAVERVRHAVRELDNDAPVHQVVCRAKHGQEYEAGEVAGADDASGAAGAHVRLQGPRVQRHFGEASAFVVCSALCEVVVVRRVRNRLREAAESARGRAEMKFKVPAVDRQLSVANTTSNETCNAMNSPHCFSLFVFSSST